MSSSPPTPPENEFTLSPGTVIGDRFVLTAAVGAGSQGEVYQAEDREIRGHVVALKVMREAARSEVARELALRELELLAAVRHPSVLQFYDYGWHEGRLWYAMPWLVGETLEEKRLTRAEAQPIFEKLAAGLHALHRAGIRHQDIKPANIFLARIEGYDEPMPILLDLGVAVRAGETLAAGSLGYFAPEVAGSWPRPNVELDGKADVFALALTLREVLEPDTLPPLPERHEEVPAYLASRANQPIAPPSRFELKYLRRAFSEWLHLDPARRPDANSFRAQLAVLTEPERRRKRLIRYGAVGVVIATLLAFGAHQTLRAQALHEQSEEHARAAAERTDEADEAKERARRAAKEAELAAVRANEAQRHASDSAEEAAKAKRLRRAAEAAAKRASEAEQDSLLTARAARAARSAAELARRAAEQKVATSDLERARLAAELARLREEHARTTSALGEARAAATALREQLTRAESALAASREEQTKLSGALATARGSLEEATAARQALESELGTLRARIEALESRLASQTPRGDGPAAESGG